MLIRLIGPRQVRVHAGAFVAAAVLTPLVFSLTGVIFLLYGVVVTAYAAILGLPAMICLGLPLAYLAISRVPLSDGTASVGAIATSGFIANGLALPLGFGVLTLSGQDAGSAWAFMLFYCGCGLLAAPLQAAIFGVVYRVIAPRAEPVIDTEIFA